VIFDDSSDSEPFNITLTNNGSTDISIDTASITGHHSEDFNITNDGCSSQTLSTNDSCDIEVAFTPKNKGVKNALLEIPYNEGTLYIFLSNHEDSAHNARKRLSPVAYDINISEKLDANTPYDLNWSIIGYHEDYKVMVVMFDCTDVAEGECGSSYNNSEKFLESPLLSPSSIESANWTYKGEQASKFNYSYNVTMPTQRANGDDWNETGNDIVIRFYVLSKEDENEGKDSLSLIIPGNLSERYYDTSGRKIEKKMCPSTGCSE